MGILGYTYGMHRDSNFFMKYTAAMVLAFVLFMDFFSKVQASEVVTLEREQWEAWGATTVGEALGRSGRIHVVNAGGPGHRSAAWVNGASASEIEIFLNGLPIAEMSRSAVDLSQYRLEGLSRIEITDGVSKTLPGQGARKIGINLVTRKASKWTGSASGSAGSFGTYGGGAEGFSPVGVGAAGGYDQSDGSQTSMRWVARHGLLSFSREMDEKHSLQGAVLGYSDALNEGSSAFGSVDSSRERWIAAVSGRWALSEKADVRVGISGLFASRRYGTSSGLATSGALRQGSLEWALVNQVSETDTATIHFGFHEASVDEGIFLAPKWGWGEFIVQNQLVFQEMMRFTAELRLDQHSAFGPFLSPTIELEATLGGNKVLLSVANTVQFPRMDEKYFTTLSYGGTTWSGNPLLEPERTWMYRLGVSHQVEGGMSMGFELSGGGGESVMDHHWQAGIGGVRSPVVLASARTVGAGISLGIPLWEGASYRAGYQFREWRSGATLVTDRPRQVVTQSLQWELDGGFVCSGWSTYAQFPSSGLTPYPFAESVGASVESMNYGVAVSWQAAPTWRVTGTAELPGLAAGRTGIEGYAQAGNAFTVSVSASW